MCGLLQLNLLCRFSEATAANVCRLNVFCLKHSNVGLMCLQQQLFYSWRKAAKHEGSKQIEIEILHLLVLNWCMVYSACAALHWLPKFWVICINKGVWTLPGLMGWWVWMAAKPLRRLPGQMELRCSSRLTKMLLLLLFQTSLSSGQNKSAAVFSGVPPIDVT